MVKREKIKVKKKIDWKYEMALISWIYYSNFMGGIYISFTFDGS